MNEYTKQANDFLAKTNTTMTAQYLGHWPHLGEWSTSQWQVTFTSQGRKPFTLTFSQSLAESWSFINMDRNKGGVHQKQKGLPPALNQKHWPRTSGEYVVHPYLMCPAKRPPSAYDVLACLTKYDPGTFKDFCADFGYSDDSIKALEPYRAVQEEWSAVERMFNDCLEELQEIS